MIVYIIMVINKIVMMSYIVNVVIIMIGLLGIDFISYW